MDSPQTRFMAKEILAAGTKRKRASSHADASALGAAFTIRKHPHSADDGGMRIEPQLLISRANLPLSFLVPQDDCHSLPRIFRGHVRPLETAEQQEFSHRGPRVLIATDEYAEHNVYVIERVAKGLYALCRLAGWVQLKDFEGAGYWSKKEKETLHNSMSDRNNECRNVTDAKLQGVSKVSISHRHLPSQTIRLLMKPPYVTSVEGKDQNMPSPDQSMGQQQPPAPEPVYQESLAMVEPIPPADLDEVLDNLKRQYLEALYNSKASLAYFAKGPLSRPRGLLLQDDLPIPSSQQVSEALRSCILSRTMLDTKYSTTLPNLTKDLPVGIPSDDEECDVQMSSQTKFRKPKKRKKLGKNGLFPGEEECIVKWYAQATRAQANDNQTFSREERAKNATASQRSRETQMQIALILEVISLELSPPPKASAESVVPIENVVQNGPASKMKKSQNLSELLDVLVERLCIWQSTDLDLNELPKVKLQGNLELEKQTTSNTQSKNNLEDFCTQVIIPFYAARVSDLSASVCRRLGVSIWPSPKRPQLARVMPGSRHMDMETSRSQQLKRRKTLKRVLTDDKLTRQGPTASLMRSNTDSAIPRIKREVSEVSLSEVPTTKGIKAIPRQYSQREVDLTAVSRVAEARLQRKQLIEQEKNAAIALLKRPNARLAVMDLVESKDQREAGAKARSRKSKNPVRNIFAQGVQVMATPQTNRYKDVLHSPPKLIPARYEPSLELEAIPPSSDPKIPSSSLKPTHGANPHSQETPSRALASTNKMRLPLKGETKSGPSAPVNHDAPAKRLSRLAVPRIPLSVVEENGKRGVNWMNCAETPSRGQSRKGTTSSFPKGEQPETSCLTPSRTVCRKTVASTPLTVNRTGGKAVASTSSKGKKSIYESLGWDNDDVNDFI